MQLADGTYLSFRYNDEGVRTRKTVNGVETYFYLDGTNILAQKTGSDILWFNYDANGTRISITMPNGAVYYYAYNAQGDVIGLYSVNQYGYFVPQVYYTYDAWGKVLSITGNMADTLGQQNPFRYRGYYYDSETQFYYLNSRYYDPEVGRFINADTMIKTPGTNVLSANMFAYCQNNPVRRVDSNGQWFGLDDVIAGAVGGLVGVASQFISDVVTSVMNDSWQLSSWQTYFGAGIGGIIGGVTAIYAGPVIGTAVGAGSSTLIGQTLETFTGGQKRSAGEIIKNTVVDTTVGALVSKVMPVNVSKITTGRNSMSAVYQSGLSKIRNKTASSMSLKVLGKGFVSSLVSDVSLATSMGVKSFLSDAWQNNQSKNSNPSSPVYWSAP